MAIEVDAYNYLKAIADQIDLTKARVIANSELTEVIATELNTLGRDNKVLTLYSTPNQNELVAGFHLYGSSPISNGFGDSGGPFGSQSISFLVLEHSLPDVLLEGAPLAMDFYLECGICQGKDLGESACLGPSFPSSKFRGDCEDGEILWDFSGLFFQSSQG